jgi:cytidylate kinase
MAVVVISRQVGSYGDEIAALVAGKLGHQLIDQPRVHELAQRCDLEFKKACALYETELQPGFLESLFFHSPAYTSLFESLTFELAGRGDVVLVGRGAQVVLKDYPNVFKGRIVAPLEVRARRIKEQRKVSVEEAREFAQKHDTKRRALLNTVYHDDLRDWDLFNIVLNTVSHTPEAGAEIICGAVESMEKVPENGTLQEKLKNMAHAKRIESVIKKKIITSPYRNISVTFSSEGVATLAGYVQDKRTMAQAEEIALGVEGVKKVDNTLKTTDLSF